MRSSCRVFRNRDDSRSDPGAVTRKQLGVSAAMPQSRFCSLIPASLPFGQQLDTPRQRHSAMNTQFAQAAGILIEFVRGLRVHQGIYVETYCPVQSPSHSRKHA
jgi:hypothetical protein